MRYKITKIQCEFSNGSKEAIIPGTTTLIISNTCDDIDRYRSDIRDELNMRLSILGIKVDSIFLTYEDRNEQK
jgi:hypothetical protein